MKRQRIAQILEATTGGTRRHVLDLVEGIDPSRFEVDLICAVGRDPAFASDIEALRARGIAVHLTPMVRSVSARKDLAAFRRITGLLEANRYDLVHTHSSKAGVLGRLAARRSRVSALVHTAHVFPFEMGCGAAAKLLYRLIERRLARWTDRLICVSRTGMCSGIKAGVAPLGRYAIIVNGVDLAGFDSVQINPAGFRTALNIPATAPVIGAVGRLTRQKNFALLLEAFVLISHFLPNARLVLLGEGEDRPVLERQVAMSGLKDRVLMPGVRQNIPDWMALFDVFAMSSAWEGMPYSLLEAMGCRKTVVATAVGGVAEAIKTGVNGVLTPNGRADLLATALLERLQAPPDDRRRMGEAARRTVQEKFSKSRMLTNLQDLYGEVMES